MLQSRLFYDMTMRAKKTSESELQLPGGLSIPRANLSFKIGVMMTSER
jgi:hypothetical protein